MPTTHSITRTRQATTVDFRPGQKVGAKIETGGIIKQLMFRLRATVTQGVANDHSQGFGQILRMLRQVEVKVNENDTVMSLDGPGLLLRSYYDFGAHPSGYGSLPFVAGSTQHYDIFIPIAFYLPRSRTPDLTALDLRGALSCTLNVDWANSPEGSIYQKGQENKARVENVQFEIVADYADNYPAEMAQKYVREMKYTSNVVSADNPAYEYRIQRNTGRVIKSLVIMQTRGDYSTLTTPGAFRPPIFNGEIEIAAGHEIYKQGPVQHFLAHESSRNQYEAMAGTIPFDFADLADTSQALDLQQLDSDLVIRGQVRGPIPPANEDALLLVYLDCIRAPRWRA